MSIDQFLGLPNAAAHPQTAQRFVGCSGWLGTILIDIEMLFTAILILLSTAYALLFMDSLFDYPKFLESCYGTLRFWIEF